MKIEIDIEQQKDGGLALKYNGINLGELNNLNPIDEINKVSALIKFREKIVGDTELQNLFDKAIEYSLVKLLAWYYTE